MHKCGTVSARRVDERGMSIVVLMWLLGRECSEEC